MSLRTLIQPFRIAFDQVVDGVIVVDTEGSCIYSNAGFREIFEIPPSRKSRPQWKEVSPVEYCELVRRMELSYATLLEDFPVRIRKKKRELNATVKSLEFNGKWMGALVIFRNPLYKDTENKYLVAHNPILRAINARRESSCFVIDMSTGRTIFVSDSLERLTGWDTRLFTEGGLSFSFSMMHPRDAPLASAALFEWVKQKNQNKQVFDHIPLNINVRLREKSGQWLPFSNEINVLERDAKGKIRYLFGSYKILSSEPNFSGETSGTPSMHSDRFRIFEGKTFINVDYLKSIQGAGLEVKNTNGSSENASQLSTREREIIKLILDGFSSAQISKKLFISKNTVNMHRKQIMKKLKAKNLVELVKIGLRDSLV